MMKKSADLDEQRLVEHSQQNINAQRDQMLAGADQIGRTSIASTEGQNAAESAQGGVGSVENAVPAQFVAMAQETGKELPEMGKIWVYPGKDQNTGKMVNEFIRIKQINWDENLVVFDRIDNKNNNQILPGYENLNRSIDDLMTFGQEKGKLVSFWSSYVASGNMIRLGENQGLSDRLDVSGQRQIPAGDFKLKMSADGKHAELIKDQTKYLVDMSDLTFSGAEILESPEKKSGNVDLVANHRYVLPEGINLPAELSGLNLSDQVIVRKSGKEVLIENVKTGEGGSGRPIVLSENLFEIFAANYKDMGEAKSGGGQGKQNKRREN
jgi:hypothetical protein